MEEGRYGLYNHGSVNSTSLRNEEFQEEDIWGILKEKREFTSEVVSSKPTHYIALRSLPNAARMIPRSSQSNNSEEPKMAQQSAPVSIPDWSKIYGKKKKKSVEGSWHDRNDDDGHGVMDGSWDSDDDGDDDGSYMMPPHEYIARKHARTQTPSFSVCEGIGRTLKGRDLSRVRNAVLTRTGFLE